MACRPSQMMSGTTAKAAIGSAHATRQIALTASPANAITERQAHNADSAASALSAALPVDADRRRFSLASHGMIAAAAIRTAIPRSVGLGSLYPSRAMAAAATTYAASPYNNPPVMRAARRSMCSCAAWARNLHSTTTAERSSMALSPPKASNAGLCAHQAAKRETTASTIIHAIVTAWTRRMRRRASGVAICNTEAIWVGSLSHHGKYGSRPTSGAVAKQDRFVPGAGSLESAQRSSDLP